MKAVKVHCGSAHVKGNARKYRYYVASLFVVHVTSDGRRVWRNSGNSTFPRRSLDLCRKDAKAFALIHGAMYIPGYGSLHNTSADPVLSIPIAV